MTDFRWGTIDVNMDVNVNSMERAVITTSTHSVGRNRWQRCAVLPHVLAIALVAVAAVRIQMAGWRLSQTFDEPFHVLRGMQWLSGHKYDYVEHPPLAPIIFAVGARAAGARLVDSGDKLRDGNSILQSTDSGARVLWFARSGNLLFVLWACWTVWHWTTACAGSWAALFAVFVFTSLPPILAHACVATTDLAATAAIAASVHACILWRRDPQPAQSVQLGVFTGLALLSKFSAAAFVPIAYTLTIVTSLLVCDSRVRVGCVSCAWHLARAIGTAIAIVWLGYGLSVGAVAHDHVAPITTEPEPTNAIQVVRNLLKDRTIPFPEFIDGLCAIGRKQQKGHAPYFLGERGRPSLLFFPIMLVLKTPIPLIVVFAVGCCAPLFKNCPWEVSVAVAVSCGIAVVLAYSKINLGVRHALPIYPFLCIAGGYGMARLLQQASRRGVAVLGCGLCAALIAIESQRPYPDYFAYFNGLAGSDPSLVVVDSDLDWGQGLLQCGEVLREHAVSSVRLAYFGTGDPTLLGLPDVMRLEPHQKRSGWIACSVTALRSTPGYEWLEQYAYLKDSPASIRIYYIPGAP